jgi:hypothetical protein
MYNLSFSSIILSKDEADELKCLICSVAEYKSYCVLSLEEVNKLWMDSFFWETMDGFLNM